MLDLTKYFKKLDKQLGSKVLTAPRLAAAMTAIISQEGFIGGDLLPTQSETKSNLNTTIPLVQKAWAIMANHYGVIETQQGIGTFVASPLTYEDKKMINEKLAKFESSEHTILLNKRTISVINEKADGKIRHALELHRDEIEPQETIDVIPGLPGQFSSLISEITGHKFNKDEVYYTNLYNNLIMTLLLVFSDYGQSVVVMTPISGLLRRTMLKVHRSIKMIGLNSSLNLMDDLRDQCATGNVAVVVVGPIAPYPLVAPYRDADWNTLLALQDKYCFKIIMEIMLPGWVEFPNLLGGISSVSKGSILVVMRVSGYYHFNDVTLVAGSQHDIGILKMRYQKYEQQMPALYGYALRHLLKETDFRNAELKAYEVIKKLMPAAKKALKAPGIFNAEYIDQQQGWYIYLELITGSFPKHIFSLLAENHIHIQHPKLRSLHPQFRNGIVISLANYDRESLMLNHLGLLIRVVLTCAKLKN